MLGGAEALIFSETSLSSVFDGINEWWESLFPIYTGNDLPATVLIDDETHHPKRTVMMPQTFPGPRGMTQTRLMPIVQAAYDTFTVTIEGQQHTIRVSPEDAAKYEPEDKIEVTYDKAQYKDGTVRISDVKLRRS